MDLVVRGSTLPTFLLDWVVAATCAAQVEPCPPQTVRLHHARRTTEFAALVPLLAAEPRDWDFVPAAT